MNRSPLLLGFLAAVGLCAFSPAVSAADRPLGGEVHGPSELSTRLTEISSPQVADASAAKQADALDLPARGAGSLLRRGERIVVEVRLSNGRRGLAGLRAAGAETIGFSARYGIATVAAMPDSLRDLARAPGVEGVVEQLSPVFSAATCPQGISISEGDAQLEAAAARSTYGVDGAGVKVGVLSDSYDKDLFAVTHAADDVLSGDLPGAANTCVGQATTVDVVEESFAFEDDEGRAMLQIVHDIAPGAELAFATAAGGDIQFAENIRRLAAAGADVIVDDVFYYNEPFFQDGPVSVAVRDVRSQGVAYFSSAGNNNLPNGLASWEAPAFRPASGCPAPLPVAAQCMDFDPGAGSDTDFGFTVANGRAFQLILQWAEPWYGVQNDIDVMLIDDLGDVLASSQNRNRSGQPHSIEQPYEAFSWTNATGGTKHVRLVIHRFDGTGTPRLKFIFPLNGRGGIDSPEYSASNSTDTFGPAVFGHSGAADAMSIAAVPFDDSSAPEPFSSRGPVTLVYEPVLNGPFPAAPLPSPQTLSKPDIAATDCGANTFFGSLYVATATWRFCGTSAAAPHAAGVAALQLDRNPTVHPEQIYAAQTGTATSMSGFGPLDVGSGLLHAPGAVAATPLEPMARTLTVSRNGAGTVVSSPAGIECGTTCEAPFSHDEPVTLTATPDLGSTFSGWSGAGCAGTGTCQVTMSADRTVGATFATAPPVETCETNPALCPPPNDDFADAQQISGAAISRTSDSNVNATKELGEPSHAPSGNPGGASIWYAWQAPGSGPVTIDTAGSDFDTFLGVHRGSAVAALDEVVLNDDAPGALTSKVTFIPTAGQAYMIAVDGYNNDLGAATGTVHLNLSQQPPGPPPRTLTVNRTGPGFVFSTPVGIGCGTICVGQFNDGATVTLTANPSQGSTFTGWSGAGCAGTGACQVTMSADRTVSATFATAPPVETCETNPALCPPPQDQGSPSPTPAPEPAPTPVPRPTPSPPPSLKCKKGFQKKKVRGKPRCVKAKKRAAKKRRPNAHKSSGPARFWGLLQGWG